MGAMRGIGALVLILSVPTFLAGLIAMFSTSELVPPVLGDSTGVALLGLGGVLLLAGILLLVISPKKEAPEQPVVGAPVQEVEIKRTEMNWGAGQSKPPTDELQSELDAVDQKIGQTKVRYGVGELSGEAYKMILADYEKERAAIQRRIIEQQR